MRLRYPNFKTTFFIYAVLSPYQRFCLENRREEDELVTRCGSSNLPVKITSLVYDIHFI